MTVSILLNVRSVTGVLACFSASLLQMIIRCFHGNNSLLAKLSMADQDELKVMVLLCEQRQR